MARVLIADAMSPRALEVFRARGIETESRPGLPPAELAGLIGGFDGLAVRSATQVTADLLAAAARLKVIGRAGIGIDNIDVDAATRAGMVVMNTPHGNAITTAEHAIAMMFALARRIPAADRSTQAGEWRKSAFLGTELTGKSLGLIGCGNVGSVVADRAHGLHMRVSAYDPFLSEERARDLGVRKLELAALLATSDVISLHTPLTPATRNIIDEAALAAVRPGALLINCARGGLVDETALRRALEQGRVGGAAIDVFSTEPARENVLFGAPNLIATPHLGAATAEAQEKVAVQIAEQMADFLLHGAVANAVNMPSMTAEEAPVLRPYMRLGQALGAFVGQVLTSPVRSVALECEGLAAALNPQPALAAALAGLLRPQLSSVNMVNAPRIAADRGIAVSVTRHDRPCDYQTLLRLTVVEEARTRTLVGTLFGGDKPRLVEVQGIAIEAEFGQNMLYVRNYDRPGTIGALGTALGDAGCNIATFHLGRRGVGGEAIALVELDQPVDAGTVARIRALPQVVRVNALHF